MDKELRNRMAKALTGNAAILRQMATMLDKEALTLESLGTASGANLGHVGRNLKSATWALDDMEYQLKQGGQAHSPGPEVTP